MIKLSQYSVYSYYYGCWERICVLALIIGYLIIKYNDPKTKDF